MRFSQRSLNRMNGVDPRLARVFHRAIEITVLDFGIPEYGGVRDTLIQSQLFTRGLSRCDGFQKISNHQVKDKYHPELPELGRALDFYAIDPNTGKASWDRGHMAYVAAAILQAASLEEVKVEWGGLWPWDMPHIQLSSSQLSPSSGGLGAGGR